MNYIALCYLSFFTATAWAWNPLQTANEKAYGDMQQGHFKTAAATFKDVAWRATAAFRASDYATAAKLYASLNTDEGFYNAGNAYAHLHQFDAAIKAYNQALALNSHHEDARYNLDKLKQQQQQKDKQKDKQDDASQKKPDSSNDKKNQDDPKSQKKEAKNPTPQPQKPEEKEGQHQPSPEAQQAQEKAMAHQTWLKMVPDDPGGLLREKFLRDYLRSQGEVSHD